MDRRRHPERLARASAVLAIALTAVYSGCTAGPYVIGAYLEASPARADASGPDAAADGGSDASPSSTATFAATLSQSGTSQLDPALALPSGPLAATLRLRGESATADTWPSDQGPVLAGAQAAASTNLDAPFPDATRAVGFVADAPAYAAPTADIADLDADDAVFEVVLRAVPGAVMLDKRGAGSGWALETNALGSLVLELDDGQNLATVASEPLTSDAWYHCMFWVTHGTASSPATGRADCDGRQGTPSDLSALGAVPSTMNLAVGGNAAGSGGLTELADFSLFRAPAGSLAGVEVDWLTIGRTRFAALTGSLPQVALGSLLPNPGMRDSVAYLDLDRDDGSGRHLFLVGPDWPRVACRTDVAGVNGCGYLSEPGGTRLLDPDPTAAAWAPSEVTLIANHALFADGDTRMAALVPSTQSAPHVLTSTASVGPAQEVFSFFARAESGRFVGASVSVHGEAVFDLQTQAVTAPAGVHATIEPWGAGLFRCAYVFTAEAGSLAYSVHLLDNMPTDVFAGNGATAWLDVWGLQLDVSSAFPISLLGATTQDADELEFVGNDGNLPKTSAASLQVRFLLPVGPRLTDQALVNLNLGDSKEQPQNQVNLFVTGNADSGKLSFWGLQGGTTYWTVEYPVSAPYPSAVDGMWHGLQARCAPQSVVMSVDGVAASWPPQKVSPSPFAFDRIDVGFSAQSSGDLAGLVGGIQIGPQ